MAGLLERILGMMGAQAPARRVAGALAERMGASVASAGTIHRLRGSWGACRCQLTLDGDGDRMEVTARLPGGEGGWSMRWVDGSTQDADLELVSTHVALSSQDAARLDKLPLSTRLHAIEVVEAGRGSLVCRDGSLRMQIERAGLAKDNAVEQAEIRMDVLADLATALPKSFNS